MLVADKNMEYTIKGLLHRTPSLNIRRLTVDCFVHPEHDPGCLLHGHDFLRPFANKYSHALVMLDREGCGREQLSREALESQIEELLAHSGWGQRSAAIVIDPELEVWVWSNSPYVDQTLGWSERNPDLRTWLFKEQLIPGREAKPARPKKALELALRQAGKARSSSLFYQLASVVSLKRCTNPAFNKLMTTLQNWFPKTL
ncbi:MAG: hypothetical protein K6T29_03830 [Peptococcaceae bacterium]|nr:hypothetical protein [Peptococcaceae bacterium]